MSASHQPKTRKGRFVAKSTGIVIPFMFNPSEIPFDHGWSWGEQPIPGRSHPHISGGAGDAEVWVMDLHFDGDRGRVGTRPRFEGGLINPFVPDVGLDVMPEINTIRQTVLPNDPDLGEAYGTPDSYLCSFGSIFRGEILVRNISGVITYMTPKLEAVRGDVSVTFTILRRFNRTNWIFINEEVSNALTEDPEVIPGGTG